MLKKDQSAHLMGTAVGKLAKRSEARFPTATGGRSSTPRSKKTVGEFDRRRSHEISPNSRLSRRGASRRASSHSQGRDIVMDVTFKSFVGIDIAKRTLDVHVLPERTSLKQQNDSKGRRQLREKLPPPGECLIVIEATGGYERALVAELIDDGHQVAVVNPRQARDFAKACGNLAKTDRIDAAVLARFGQAVELRIQAKIPEKQLELQDLVARRRQLVELRTAEMNRKEHVASKFVKKSLQQSVDALNKEIRRFEKRIAELVQSTTIGNRSSRSFKARRGLERARAPPCLPKSPSWDSSADERSPHWSAWPPSTATAASSGDAARSAADEGRCAAACTWRRSVHVAPTQSSKPSRIA
jgi:hypothetical protein